MFVISFYQSFCPRWGRSHVAITHDTLDLTIQGPPGHMTSLYRDSLDPSPSPWGQDWIPVQTCSLEDPPTSADIWWLLHKHVQSAKAGSIHHTGMLSLFNKKNRTLLHLVTETSRLSTPIIYYYIFNRYLKSYIKEKPIFNYKSKIITFDTKFSL